MLRQKARPYLFSNALPPPVVACAIKVFDLLMEPGNDLPGKLLSNTKRFRAAMRSAGFQLGVRGDSFFTNFTNSAVEYVQLRNLGAPRPSATGRH